MDINELLALIFIIVVIAFAVWLYKRLHKPDITKLYNAKTILTDREYEFYTRLKPLAHQYGLNIYTKVRLADLIEPKPKEENPYWMECFNKIKAKHIDFALADDETCIVALIDARADRVERDDFVNAVLENTGYTLLRTYGDLDVIEEYLK